MSLHTDQFRDRDFLPTFSGSKGEALPSGHGLENKVVDRQVRLG